MTMSDIYSWGIGFFILVVLISLIPAFIGYSRGHAYRHIILVLCLFGSWTGILWIVAFVWAVWPSDKSLIDPIAGNATGTGTRNAGDTIGAVKVGIDRGAQQETLTTVTSNAAYKPSMSAVDKLCPFCAETIKAAAIKCRHCGSAIT